MKRIYFDAYTTRFDILKKHWEKHSPLLEKGTVGTNEPIVNVDLGGILVEIDWDQKKITKNVSIRCPGGMIKWNGLLVVPSMWKHEIYLFDEKLGLVKSFTHPYLSDMHSISVTSDNTLLVASTGIDALLEFNFQGELIWTWFATLNGFTTDQLGNERNLIIENVDHRKNEYPTLTQTTHLNSVIEDPYSKNHVLTTLFHQGQIIRVDKKTGEAKILLDGLISPHGLRRLVNGFIVTNTRRGEVLMLDDNFAIIKRFDLDSTWLQDSCLSSWDSLLGIRADKCDIVEVSLENGEILSTFKYDENWRGYQIFLPD
jgi:hypothetical protein